MEDDTSVHLVKPSDRIAFLVCLGIATTDKHHTDCCTFIELDFPLVKIAMSNAFKQVYDITFQAKHYAFCLWITHTAVVFDNHGFAGNIDKPEEDEAFIIYSLVSKTFNSWANDAVFHFLHPLFCGKWNG